MIYKLQIQEQYLIMTNKLINITLIIFIIHQVSSIDQKCSSTSDCPANSQCSSQTDYCVCNDYYILDCNTLSTKLTEDPQQFDITTDPSYYTTIPTYQNTYYFYIYTICSDHDIQGASLIFSLWGYDGQTQLKKKGKSSNYVGQDTIDAQNLADSQGCYQIITPTFEFGSQPNGNSQTLITQLKLQAIGSKDLNGTQFQITMKVQQIQIANDHLLYTLAIVIISVIIFALIVTLIWCLYKRWKNASVSREKMNYLKRMVDYFKEEMPEVQFKDLNLPQLTNCTVCLGDFSPSEKVRHLMCGHVFHSNCIDAWCLKNLSCPVCRFELDQTSIELKKKQKEMNRSFDGTMNVELQGMSERPYTDRTQMRSVRESLMEQNPV